MPNEHHTRQLRELAIEQRANLDRTNRIHHLERQLERERRTSEELRNRIVHLEDQVERMKAGREDPPGGQARNAAVEARLADLPPRARGRQGVHRAAALGVISPRQEFVLKRYLFDRVSMSAIGVEQACSGGRVNEIINTACTKLKVYYTGRGART